MLTKSLNRENWCENGGENVSLSLSITREGEKKKILKNSRRLGRAEHLLEDLVLVDDPQDAVRGRLGDAREHVSLLDGALVEHPRGLVDGAGELWKVFYCFEISR